MFYEYPSVTERRALLFGLSTTLHEIILETATCIKVLTENTALSVELGRPPCSSTIANYQVDY